VQAIESHGFAQQVTGSTHNGGHTLDVVITSEGAQVKNLVVNPPTYSDHSLIEFSSEISAVTAKRKTIYRRPWAKLDKDSFAAELGDAKFVSSPSENEMEDAQDLFSQYDEVLVQLADKYAPLKKVTIREERCCLWFDADCRNSKRLVRRLESVYRRTSSDADRDIWKNQFKQQRQLFQDKRSDFLRCRIQASKSDIKNQWRVLSSLLSAPTDPKSCPISADTFKSFFTDKVAGVRLTTEGAHPPKLSRSVQSGICNFRRLTADDTISLLRASASKSCELDVVPTWLIRY
jgi:hypothetical protein